MLYTAVQFRIAQQHEESCSRRHARNAASYRSCSGCRCLRSRQPLAKASQAFSHRCTILSVECAYRRTLMCDSCVVDEKTVTYVTFLTQHTTCERNLKYMRILDCAQCLRASIPGRTFRIRALSTPILGYAIFNDRMLPRVLRRKKPLSKRHQKRKRLMRRRLLLVSYLSYS